MARYIVVVRFDGAEIASRGFMTAERANSYAMETEQMGDCEMDGPQFTAEVYSV